MFSRGDGGRGRPDLQGLPQPARMASCATAWISSSKNRAKIRRVAIVFSPNPGGAPGDSEEVRVGPSGIEPLTSSVSRKRSPSELRAPSEVPIPEATSGIEPE